MDNTIKKVLIDNLSRALAADGQQTLTHRDKPLAIVVPVQSYEKFKAEREEKLKNLETELNSLIKLIRTHTHHQTLAEVEARLAALREKIEQEME